MRKLPTLDLFAALVFQVIGQQISVVAATAIFAHLIERFHGLAPDPEDLVDLEPETLRELGQLTEVKGVGPWTAKGALLIALQRPDLVRTNDVALRHSIQVHYGSDHLPDPNEVAALARRWSPYGSLASSLLLANARKM
jgi:DNA-3-methyladenine glycosylase II